MKKVKVKIPAKINLTLDITGNSGGYHLINSLVASVNLFDAVTLYRRDDGNITLTEKGITVGGNIADNNAYKAVKAFSERYATTGADIVLQKSIPIGGGLGGSSADIAAALIGMRALYGADCDIETLAAKLGSDVNYMLHGGYAVMSGRGEIVRPVKTNAAFHVLLITGNCQVYARDSYAKYDELGCNLPETTSEAVRYIKEGDTDGVLSCVGNALTVASSLICPEISANLAALKAVGADAAVMSGSGSTVCGLFRTQAGLKRARRALTSVYPSRMITARTL